MGGSASKSESESESGFKQDVWEPQGNALSGLYENMGNLFGNQTMSQLNQYMEPASEYMNQIRDQSNPFWQQQMEGGAYRDMGLQNNLMNSLNQSLGQPSDESQLDAMIMGGDGNNYADAMKNMFVQDATRAQENMLQNLDARAAASGMSGGSRHGMATAQGMEDINQNLQDNMARTGYETFDKDLDRKLGIAQRADQGTLARQNMLSSMISQQQGAMQGGLGYGQDMQNLGMGSFAPAMVPWQAASQYANSIGRPTVLGSGSMEGDSKATGMSGGIGGGK